MYQIQRFHGFLWASGGCFSDFLIHNIDECCWMKDAWPVNAKGSGARTYREDNIDQNFDTYSVEYTFDDGTKFFLEGRNIPGRHQEFASYAHGSKGSAVISTSATRRPSAGSTRAEGHPKDLVWSAPAARGQPVSARVGSPDRRDPERQARTTRSSEAPRPASSPRWAAWPAIPARSSRSTTCSTANTSSRRPLDQLTSDSPAPLQKGANGLYPVPQPGIVRDREF